MSYNRATQKLRIKHRIDWEEILTEEFSKEGLIRRVDSNDLLVEIYALKAELNKIKGQ